MKTSQREIKVPVFQSSQQETPMGELTIFDYGYLPTDVEYGFIPSIQVDEWDEDEKGGLKIKKARIVSISLVPNYIKQEVQKPVLEYRKQVMEMSKKETIIQLSKLVFAVLMIILLAIIAFK